MNPNEETVRNYRCPMYRDCLTSGAVRNEQDLSCERCANRNSEAPIDREELLSDVEACKELLAAIFDMKRGATPV
jgi:hypothetical protein